MAFIPYLSQDKIPVDHRVSDHDNIVQIHSVHSKVMKMHLDLYLEMMRKKGPLSFIQREMIAVLVSSINKCFY
ncbi:MAG: hypothetical protein HN729_03525 [Candidatus Marinimicrobia bacterium]|jgi:hypothetical protein|nr:hypothetical protein [Candidatus Neomarinimicrobiota bacterium]MBT3635157.1 hypothetical protein [Candidatus Neomarinimicrobiota bacterium]MBT3683809.1 hypothetical protein [Candidatus Neomarinimicrobiota bacterium]MBT3760799.1 hypothetical protein [Candidatus Neomarinimicrobiota bacterium]MBT3896970.1 hypothetical protein [Candidatus Neomarinimicrobiota bacterium]